MAKKKNKQTDWLKIKEENSDTDKMYNLVDCLKIDATKLDTVQKEALHSLIAKLTQELNLQ